jgi:hypothetical protein
VRSVALVLLVFACIHEFAWQLFPAGVGIHGNVRNVTLWPLICSACITIAVLARDRFATAVCVAVAMMTSTTALCSAWWLASPFDTGPGKWQCSTQLGQPIFLVSIIAALLTFWRYPRE